MRIFRDNSEYQGTPEELSMFFRLNEPVVESDPWAQVEPLRDIVSESEELRRKLADNPDYSPFGGVVPSKETEQAQNIPRVVTADKDTGVELI